MATCSLSSIISFLVPSKLNLRRPAAPSQNQQVGYRQQQLGWPKKTTVLCLSTGFNVQVMVEDNEPEERLLGRFRREVMRAGVIQECKRRRFFENKQEEKKRKTREAAKRNRKRRPRVPFSKKDEAPSSKRDEDDEDNWEMPSGGIP